jgi:hypothetical protein
MLAIDLGEPSQGSEINNARNRLAQLQMGTSHSKPHARPAVMKAHVDGHGCAAGRCTL